jgi:hypothetical protein
MTLIFDLETNGLLHDVTRIHCLGIYDTETKETLAYNDEGNTEPITRGLQRLEDTEVIVGHNIINYDLCVIRKLYPWFTTTGTVLDTLVLSRICHADILKTDQKRKWKGMPPQLYGRHSLESYGYRLGEYKGESLVKIPIGKSGHKRCKITWYKMSKSRLNYGTTFKSI